MPPSRRDSLKWFASTGVTMVTGRFFGGCRSSKVGRSRSVVTNVVPLPAGVKPWPTRDPFLFCVHHHDRYPKGNASLGPAASLTDRRLGYDFSGLDGWRMYHGSVVPGFPRHPHRGFETITMVNQGLCDHSDSLGAKARYGYGDVQWLTTGAGIQHAEMFPLLRHDAVNPLELFQIWLNLPRRQKLVTPHFSMFWNEEMPVLTFRDMKGARGKIKIIADGNDTSTAPAPPPNSWAADAVADLALWTLEFEPYASFTLPSCKPETLRSLYFYEGGTLDVQSQSVPVGHRIDLDRPVPVQLQNGALRAKLLLLQAKPLGESVVRYGPFVMNTKDEIGQAVRDHRRTKFGGWPWSTDDPVHGFEATRFALHENGRLEKPKAI
jgi:quercetin 2,3-dioxygenase